MVTAFLARDTARAMSQPNVVHGVRLPLSRLNMTRRHRTVDERIFVRFPALARAFASIWSRLPKHSRLRRVILLRLVGQAASAANRRDFDVLLSGFDPDIEYRVVEGGSMIAPDQVGIHHGHGGYREVWRKWLEAFEDIRLESEELIDLGDRLFSVTRMYAHGSGSGVPVSNCSFQLFTFRGGLVVRQEDFLDREKALKAAGLRE
jgi:ketosteroid isomerase-like protein